MYIFRKISLIVSGTLLIGSVMVNSILNIKDQDNVKYAEKISAPSIEIGKLIEDRILIQILFINESDRSIVHFSEEILSKSDNTFRGKFNFQDSDYNFDITLEKESVKTKHYPRFQGQSEISIKNALGSHYNSTNFYLTDKNVTNKLHSHDHKSTYELFALSRDTLDRITTFVICHRIHEDDELTTIEPKKLLSTLNLLSEHIPESKNNNGSTPFLILISTLGPCCIVLLAGAIFISLGIKKEFTFPAVLTVTIIMAVGVKKYEYSYYQSAALNKDLKLADRQLALKRAEAIPFFQNSVKKIIIQK